MDHRSIIALLRFEISSQARKCCEVSSPVLLGCEAHRLVHFKWFTRQKRSAALPRNIQGAMRVRVHSVRETQMVIEEGAEPQSLGNSSENGGKAKWDNVMIIATLEVMQRDDGRASTHWKDAFVDRMTAAVNNGLSGRGKGAISTNAVKLRLKFAVTEFEVAHNEAIADPFNSDLKTGNQAEPFQPVDSCPPGHPGGKDALLYAICIA
eukprot:scaffold340_cov256-Pinguiococcus_pyrenoidosus.AAC.35